MFRVSQTEEVNYAIPYLIVFYYMETLIYGLIHPPTLEIGDPLRSGMYSQLTGELRE